MFGYLHLEVKKNKWQKRHFFIRDGAVYHCKDAKVKYIFELILYLKKINLTLPLLLFIIRGIMKLYFVHLQILMCILLQKQ
jgi:hypothetical protein